MKSIVETATDGNSVRIAVLFQPMAAEDVASAVGRVVVGPPVNGIVEVAGPEQFRFDQFIRHGPRARNDPLPHDVSDSRRPRHSAVDGEDDNGSAGRGKAAIAATSRPAYLSKYWRSSASLRVESRVRVETFQCLGPHRILGNQRCSNIFIERQGLCAV